MRVRGNCLDGGCVRGDVEQCVEIKIHHGTDELHHRVRDALDVDEVEVGYVVIVL